MSKPLQLYQILTESELIKAKGTEIRNHYISEITIGEVMHLSMILENISGGYHECLMELIHRGKRVNSAIKN